MDMVLNLDPETERFIRDEAERRGVPAETVVAEALERDRKLAKARALLKCWDDEGDETEQRDTFEAVAKGLNEGRKGFRLHYPPELKGKTW